MEQVLNRSPPRVTFSPTLPGRRGVLRLPRDEQLAGRVGIGRGHDRCGQRVERGAGEAERRSAGPAPPRALLISAGSYLVILSAARYPCPVPGARCPLRPYSIGPRPGHMLACRTSDIPPAPPRPAPTVLSCLEVKDPEPEPPRLLALSSHPPGPGQGCVESKVLCCGVFDGIVVDRLITAKQHI